MSESNKTPLVIALVVVIVLFLFFGNGAMTGSMLGSRMMGQGGIGGYRMGHGWINGGFSLSSLSLLLLLLLLPSPLDVDSYVTHPRYRPPAWLDDLAKK